jgi:hypothetical protein
VYLPAPRRIAAALALGLLLIAVPALAQSQASSRTDMTVSTTATLICPANPNRTACNCTNNDSSINIRWGGSGVTTTSGQRVTPNGTLTTAVTGPVYAAAESSSVTLSCTDEIR